MHSLHMHTVSILTCILYNMGDAGYNGFPAWLLDTFGDPIWQHDQAPWRRHSYPARAPEESSDDSTDEFLRPDYPHSEPDRDPPEWCSSPCTFPHGPETMESSNNPAETTVMNFREIMERVADPYWADRGWVLHLIISWKQTNTNWLYRRRSDNSKRRSSKQIPPNSHHHSARRNSSNN